ncbi:MAG: hypothetical protein AAGK66_02730 [Pseudomonadota bacterium]
MTTTSDQLTQAIAAINALEQTYAQEAQAIRDQVNAAIVAAPILYQSVHVDALNGSDENLGTLAAPVATLQRAIDIIPRRGSGIIFLLSDLIVDEPVVVEDKHIRVLASETIVFRPVIQLDDYLEGSVQRAAYFDLGSNAMLYLNAIDVAIIADHSNLVTDSEIIRTRSLTSLRSDIKFLDVNFSGMTDQVVVRSGAQVFLSLMVISVTGVTGGNWLNDFAAGLDPATLNFLRTNLTAL